jgi:hypothetical protein
MYIRIEESELTVDAVNFILHTAGRVVLTRITNGAVVNSIMFFVVKSRIF